MKKIEKVIVAVAIISAAMNLMLVPAGGQLSIVIFGTLSWLYIYGICGFILDVPPNKFFKREYYNSLTQTQKFDVNLGGIGISVVILGMLFSLMSWPGSETQLMVGLLAIGVAAVKSLIALKKETSEFYKKLLVRLAFVGIIGLALALQPAGFMFRLKYRNFPELLSIHKKLQADPMNKVLQEDFNKAIGNLRRVNLRDSIKK